MSLLEESLGKAEVVALLNNTSELIRSTSSDPLSQWIGPYIRQEISNQNTNSAKIIAELNQDKIELRAHPVLIKKDSYLANLKSVRNGIEVETDLLGTLHIAGSGAGQESTASGVISDLVNLANSNDNILELDSNRNIELVDFMSLSFHVVTVSVDFM